MSLRAKKKQQTEAAIIEAATKLFAEKGYEATRTREIAEEAGIATGTLFNYAPTKSDVVLLIWKTRASALAESGLKAAQAEQDPIDAMCAIFLPILEFYAEDLPLARVYLQKIIYAPPDDPSMVPLFEGFIASLAMVIDKHTSGPSLLIASNVFAAYYICLTGMLGNRIPGPETACEMFRAMLTVQKQGWA